MRKMNNRLYPLLGALLSVFFAQTALAGSDTSNMAVSATVIDNCVISAGELAFGNYDPVVANSAAGADLEGSAALTITCTSGATAGITIGQGANADAGSTDDVPLRRMTDGTNFLSYFLYSDVARSVVWGNTLETDVDYTGTGIETATTMVYGSVTMGQNVPAGAYSDTAVVTIAF